MEAKALSAPPTTNRLHVNLIDIDMAGRYRERIAPHCFTGYIQSVYGLRLRCIRKISYGTLDTSLTCVSVSRVLRKERMIRL